MKTFKYLGLLLTYPEGSVLSESEALLACLVDDKLLSDRSIKKVRQFLNDQKSRDLFDVQEEYVETFDRGRAHSLHLFEHIHGESRDRGQAMVDLLDMYASKNLIIDTGELPDYLPLFMEYLSLCAFEDAANLLGEAVNVISMVGAKLTKRKSPYATIFSVIEKLSAISPDKVKVKKALEKSPKDPETLEEIDAEWKEAEAFSGDPLQDVAKNCNSCNEFRPNMSSEETLKWQESSNER